MTTGNPVRLDASRRTAGLPLGLVDEDVAEVAALVGVPTVESVAEVALRTALVVGLAVSALNVGTLAMDKEVEVEEPEVLEGLLADELIPFEFES